MNEKELNPDQKQRYDKIMAEIQEELDALPKSDGKQLSCAIGNRPYQEISKKYLPRLKEIMEES